MNGEMLGKMGSNRSCDGSTGSSPSRDRSEGAYPALTGLGHAQPSLRRGPSDRSFAACAKSEWGRTHSVRTKLPFAS